MPLESFVFASVALALAAGALTSGYFPIDSRFSLRIPLKMTGVSDRR
jgi:hypothetical protein